MTAPPESPAQGMTSAGVRAQVTAARALQMARQGKPNARLVPREIEAHCLPDTTGAALLAQAMARLSLSARAYHRILKVARTIADLAGSPRHRGAACRRSRRLPTFRSHVSNASAHGGIPGRRCACRACSGRVALSSTKQSSATAKIAQIAALLQKVRSSSVAPMPLIQNSDLTKVCEVPILGLCNAPPQPSGISGWLTRPQDFQCKLRNFP